MQAQPGDIDAGQLCTVLLGAGRRPEATPADCGEICKLVLVTQQLRRAGDQDDTASEPVLPERGHRLMIVVATWARRWKDAEVIHYHSLHTIRAPGCPACAVS